ncbi:MAG: NAD(P)-binding protein [Pseudomonadota bacterium]
MSDSQLDTDYLIVGSGAVGMAFADVLLHESDADMVIVDRHHKPGGHWNDAYSFVTLHQPSSFYGVSSKELSKGRKDAVGLNKGLGELATGAEVSAYFDEVMRHQFLPSGRVRYFPMCEYLGDGEFVSLLTGERHRVNARRKTVDATYLKTSVPSTHTPGFSIADGVRFMPLNGLPALAAPADGYVVIGGGKTGVDACLWLLENGVDPDTIRWIMPRDAWMLNRRNTQSSPEFFNVAMGAQAAQMEAIAQAESIEDLFDRLEAAGVMVRIDQDVRPKMFHGATVSELELDALRRIKNIVRLGRVSAIESDRIVLDEGEIPTGPGQVHVDCSASAIPNLVMKPVFEGDTITPQTVRSYQPVFSAAFIAHVEAAYDDEAVKQELCQVVPLPNHITDWVHMTAAFMMNQYRWSQDKALRAWLRDNRLDGFSQLVADVDKDDTEKQAILAKLRGNMMPAMAKLQQFMAKTQSANAG